MKLETLLAITIATVCWPLVASASPENPAALSAAKAFVAKPVAPAAVLATEARRFEDLARDDRFGLPKLVYADGTIAIAAFELMMPPMNQTIYLRLRLRLRDGVWTATDWSSLRDADDFAEAIRVMRDVRQDQFEAELKKEGRIVPSPSVEQASIRARLEGSEVMGIRDLGDGFYFIRRRP